MTHPSMLALHLRICCSVRLCVMTGVLVFASATASAQRGGDRGGGDFGGGDRAGDRGGRGRGGFDPKDFLSRLDRNGNGVLDPDEQDGPASFMIRRLEGADPSIVSGKPIPLDKFTSAFEKMRGGGSQGGDDRSDRGVTQTVEPDLSLEPLVPGFGIPSEGTPLPGFGTSAERFTIAVTEDDLKTAREALRRYDRDRDGQIDEREISRGRFWGTPLEFDRNRDGKLSESELTVRQATRRVAEAKASISEAKVDSNTDGPTQAQSLVDFEGRKSYRMSSSMDAQGLPRFFTERDSDGDHQVSMVEYSGDWDAARIEEYYRWDANGDGVITLREVRAGVDAGAVATDTTPGQRPATTSTTVSPMATAPVSSEPPSDKILTMAKTIISRYDKSGDMALSATEWEPMPLSPAAADTDGDGRITVQEYAAHMQSRSRR